MYIIIKTIVMPDNENGTSEAIHDTGEVNRGYIYLTYNSITGFSIWAGDIIFAAS